MNKIGSIYTFTNLLNGNKYVGFTVNVKNRLKSHNSSFKNGKKKALYDAMRSYGKSNFQFDIIYQSVDIEHCKDIMENYFIIEYQTYIGFENCKGYNMTLGGDGVSAGMVPWNKGITTEILKWTEKRKISHRNNLKLMWNNEKKQELSNKWTTEMKDSNRNKTKESWKNKISEGFQIKSNVTLLKCPHCNKTNNIGNSKRWHFENCKMNQQLEESIT